MPSITINRDNPTYSNRINVLPGQVFAVKTKKGHGSNTYACIGSNGRMYSVNIDTGELASSDNRNKVVVLLGTFKYKIDSEPTPGAVRECLRSEVNSGEVFTVRGKNRTYLNMGTINLDRQGFLSVPLDNTANHAISENGNSRVKVTGTFHLDVTLTH